MSTAVPMPEGATKPEEEVPWWMKYAGRGLGTFGGVVAMALGVWTCVSITPLCIVAGIWQMSVGFLVTMAESPCCCMFIEFVDRYTTFVEGRPAWNKAAAYILLSIPAMAMCPGLSTFLGSALIFATGVVYGLMSLGKKASRGEMLSRAQNDYLASTLVRNMEMPVPTQSVP